MGVAIAPSDHTRVYLITGESFGSDKGFFVSDNGDRPLADGGPTFVAGGHAGGNPRFEWWFGRLFVDPVNKNHLFKTDVSLRRSSDGGPTWANVGGPHADQHGMAWDPNVPNRVYLGNDGGMYRSDANGDSGWVHGTNMPWLQEYHVAVSQQRPNRIAIGLQDNGSNRSWSNVNDAVADPVAANWNSYGGGDGHYVVIDAAGRHLLLLVQPERRLQRRARRQLDDDDALGGGRRRRDERQARERHRPRRRQHDHDRLDGREPGDGDDDHRRHLGRDRHGRHFRAGPRVRACVGRNGREERRHRARRTSASAREAAACAARPTRRSSRTRSSVLDALPRLQRAVRSTNRGSNWTAIAAPDALTGPAPADDGPNNNPLYAGQFPTISTIAPSKSDPNTIYVGTDNGRLWKTTDLGATWQEFPNPFAPDPARWVTSVIVDPLDSNHAFASYGGFREGYTSANVYETTDGATWNNVSGNLPNAPVNFLAYDRSNDTVVRGDRPRRLLRAERRALEEARRQPAEHGHRGSEDPGCERQALRGDLRPRHVADPARGG